MAKNGSGSKNPSSFWKGSQDKSTLGKVIPKRPLSDSSARNDIPDLPKKE